MWRIEANDQCRHRAKDDDISVKPGGKRIYGVLETTYSRVAMNTALMWSSKTTKKMHTKTLPTSK